MDKPNCLNYDQDILLPVDDEDLSVEEENTRPRKRRMTRCEKYNQNIKLQQIKTQKQMNKHPVIQKTCIAK